MDLNIVRRVAQLHYNEHRTAQEISRLLKIDRRQVPLALEEAARLGVVRIYVEGTPRASDPLEEALKSRFVHLKRVIIIPGEQIVTLTQYREFLTRAAEHASRYFDELIDDHLGKVYEPKKELLHVGISGGETLLEFANALPDTPRRNIVIHSMAYIGRALLPQWSAHVDPLVNATILWSRSGRLEGRCCYATVPPYNLGLNDSLGTLATKLNAVAGIEPVIRALEFMNKIDIAIASLAAVPPGEIKASTAASPIEERRLKGLTISCLFDPTSLLGAQFNLRESLPADDKPSGDFCYHLIDAKGESKDWWRFFLSAGHYTEKSGVAFYKQMVGRKKTVMVIGGAYKIQVIKAALRGQLFNVWITDEASARQILKECSLPKGAER